MNTDNWYAPPIGVRHDPTLTDQGRRSTIREYANKYTDYRILIETGTNDGATPLALVDLFDKIYTIEINAQTFERNIPVFEKYNNIEALCGDSFFLLPDLMGRIKTPCIFWLDGHGGGGQTCGIKETPVKEELECIFRTNLPHVILVDDARLFGRDPAYPTLEWVRDIATTQDINFKFNYMDDIIRITPVP